MRWQGGRRSENIEDRRGAGIGRGRGVAVAGGGLGLGGIVVVLLLSLVFGIDPLLLLGGGDTGPTPRQEDSGGRGDDEMTQFVSVVLADTEDTWAGLFEQMGSRYDEPRLVLFSGAVESACGFAQAAVGPFYCPGDRRVYLDMAFFRDLTARFQAPGDFAQAYVIAHEIGHHVQTLLGITGSVHAARQRLPRTEANALSVRLELQADCLAGAWAHHAQRQRQVLEAGDVEEALTAASAIGDDRLQQQAQGRIAPDSFTHGTSQQRVHWFRTGLEQGSLAACDTFKSE